MKKIALVIIALCLTYGLALAQQTDRQLFRLAEQRLETGDYQLAIRSYQQLLREFPGSPYIPDSQARLGMAFFGQGQFTQAENQFRRVESRFRSSGFLSVMPLWLSLTYFELEQHTEAIQESQRFLRGRDESLELNPQQIQAAVVMARSQQILGNLQEALVTLHLVIPPNQDISPLVLRSFPTLPRELAGLYLSNLDFDLLDNLISRIPATSISAQDERFFLFARGEVALSRQELEQAREYFTGLLGRSDFLAGLGYQRLFQIAEEQENLDEQARIIRLAENDLSGNTEILIPFWLRVGQIYFQTANVDIAELYFLKIWEARFQSVTPPETVLFLTQIEQRRGDLAQATRYIQEFIQIHGTTDTRISLRAAELELLQGNPQRALGFLEPFLSPELIQSTQVLSRFHAQGFYLAAAAFFEAGQFAQGLRLINSVLGQGREGGFTAEMLEYRARKELALEQFDAAVSSFRQYLTLRPRDFRSASAYVRTLLVTNANQTAFQEGQRLIQNGAQVSNQLLRDFDRGYIELLYQTALAGLRLSRFQESLELLSALPRLASPGAGANHQWYVQLYPSILFYQGWASYQVRQDNEAVSFFQRMLEFDSNHPLAQEAAYLSGWASFRNGDVSGAAGFFQGVVMWEPDQGLAQGAQLLLARTYRATRNTSQALALLEQIWADSNHPYRLDGQFERGQLLAELNRNSEAAEVFHQLVSQAPTSRLAPFAAFRRGEVLMAARNFQGARTAFQDFRDRFPNNPSIDSALFQMGEASLALGEQGPAILFWTRLANDHRNSRFRFEALRRSAEIFESQGDRSRALSIFNELVSLYPTESEARQLSQRINQLNLVLAGFSEREAQLRVQIETLGGASSAQGRQAIIALGELVILEQQNPGQGPLNQMLTATAGAFESDPGVASRASFLLGEAAALNNQFERAAVFFLQAGESAPQNDQRRPLYFYRSIESLLSQNPRGNTEPVFARMTQLFPNHELTARARTLIQQGRN
jgi:TolA-binding protein